MWKRLVYWDIVNWHMIVAKLWCKFTIRCWTCWSLTKKSSQWIHLNSRCKKCQDIVTIHYARRSIKQWCWILWLKEDAIRNRIKRWWTIKDAIFKTIRIPVETFDERDLNYITKFYSKSYEQDKDIEHNAYIKFITNRKTWNTK